MKLYLSVLVLAASAALACSSPAPQAPEHEQHAASNSGFDPDRLLVVTDVVKKAIDHGDYAGASYLVMHDGQTVLEGAFGYADLDKKTPMRPDTIVRLYSMSKVVTCVAGLCLLEDGVITLGDPITRWLPELANLQVCTGGTPDAPTFEPLGRPIQVKHLFNHTGGFTYDFFPGTVPELYKRADLWNATSMDEFVARIAKLPLVRQPGVAFDYGFGNDVLAALVQRASGMKFEDFVAQRITKPLHLDDTFFDVPADKMSRVATLTVRDGNTLKTGPVIFGAYAEPGRGYASGGAGLFSTIRDFGRFAECLLEGGTLDGTRILGRKTVELALENSLPAPVVFDPSTGWGLFSGLRLASTEYYELGSTGTFTWSGAAATNFIADPVEHVVALVFAQHSQFDERQLFPRFHNAVYQALR